MPIYRANGNRYNIPDDKIQDFERRYPESKVEMYDGEGKKYAIPLSKRNKFQQRYEKWSYVTEETKKKSPNTFVSNQNPQNTIVSEDELENSIAYYEESLGHGKYGAANTPLFQKVRQSATSAEQIADGIIDKNWISQSPSSARDSEIGEVSVGRRGSTSTHTPVSDAYKSQFDKPLEDRFADARTRLEKDVVFQFENMLNKIEEDINENSEWRNEAEQIENEGDIFKNYKGYKNITEDTIEDLEREGYVPKEIGKLSQKRSVQNLTRKYISEARDVIEMYKRKDGNGLANFADAFARSFDSGILTLGATDAIDMGRVLAIANKIGDNGEGFEKLTREEQQLMAAFSLLDQIQGSLQLDTWQNIGQGTMQSLPFLAQFALTGGVGAAASAATKAAAKTAVKKIIGKSASKAVSRIAANAGKNAAGRVAVKAASKLGNAAIDGLVGGTVMAITSGVAHTVEDVMNRMVGNHDIRLDSINDPGGELKTIYTHHGVEDRESLGLAFLKGFAANLIENGTEYMGNYMGLNLGKLLSRFKGGRQLLTKPLIGKTTRFARQVGKLTGFNGFIPEVAEEELGMLLNAATVGDVEWKDIKDPERQFQTVMAVGIMSLGFQVANSIGVGLTYNKYRKAKKRYESKDLGEGLSVDDIIHGLDNVPLDRRADYVMAMVNTHDLGKGDAKDLQDFVMARTGYEFILGKIESDAEEAGDKAAEAEMRLINKEMGGKVTVTLLDGREAILTVGNVSLEPNATGEYTSTTQSGSLIAVPVGINTPIMVSPKDIRSVSIMSTEDAVGQARAMAEDITKTNMASQIENEADEVESDEQSRTPSSTMSGGEIGELSPRDEGVEKQPLYRKSELEIGDVVTFKNYSDPDNPGVERTLKIIGIDDSGVDVEDVVDGVHLPLSIKPEQITHVKGKEKKQTTGGDEIRLWDYITYLDEETGKQKQGRVIEISPEGEISVQVRDEELNYPYTKYVSPENIIGKYKPQEQTGNTAEQRTPSSPVSPQGNIGEVSAGQVETVVSSMKSLAEVAPEMELTPENWEAEFGDDGIVNTPIGEVKMGENQYLKLLKKKRDRYFGMIKPTLTNPDMVLEEHDPKEGAERATKYLFVKTFIKPDGKRYIHFESVTVQKDNLEVSISSHEINEEALMKKVHQDKLIHLNDKFSNSDERLTEPQKEGSDLVPTPNSISSDNKDNDIPAENQTADEKTDRWAKYRKSNGEVDEKKMPLREQFEYGEEIAGVKAMIEVAKAGTKKTQSEIARLEKEIEREISPVKRVNKEKQLKSLNERLGTYQQYLKDKEPLPDDLAPRNNIAFRRNESGETPSGQTQINERESNSNKENSLSSQEEKQIDSQDEILQSIPQRERGTEAQKDRRMEEAERAIRRSQSSGTNETQFGGSQSALSRQEIEARAAEEYAKENGLWIPMDKVFDLGTPGPSGNENDTYISNEGYVYKVNNLMNSKGILPLFDRIKLHNQIFPSSRYEFVGFTGFDGRSIYPIFRQAYVHESTNATPEEIEEYMNTLGFSKINEHKYTNGDITISDLRPRNVLKDTDGDLYVVDAEFQQEGRSDKETADKTNPRQPDNTDSTGSPLSENESSGISSSPTNSETPVSDIKDNPNASNKQEKPRLSTQKTPQERRQEIQEYIEREAGKLNIPVRIVGDVSQISPSEKNYTKKLKSQGWYDQTTGEIVIVAPNHGSIRDAQRTLLHEAVAHYGLPAMLGRENFDKLCDQVWDSMTDRERAVFGAYIDEKIDDKSYNSLTEEEKERYVANDFSGKRAAADEYLAHFAEEGITNPSLWSKIKRLIKEAFRKIGIDLSLTDSDIAYLLWKSKNRITDRDSTTDIIRKSAADTRIKESLDERFRTVYHGSGASFDRFDHSFMGTGEGAQAYGWGTYVTEVEGIGKSYAEKAADPAKKDYLYEELTKLKNIIRHEPNLYIDNRSTISDLKKQIKELEEIQRNDPDFDFEIPRLKEYEKEWEHIEDLISKVSTRVLYTVEIPDDTGENYLDWDKPITKKQIKRIQDYLSENYRKNKLDNFNASIAPSTAVNAEEIDKWSMRGENIYKTLENLLGGDREASEALLQCGFTGIKYPAQATTGGRSDGARNYVIFNENDLQITDHTRFRTSEYTPEEQDIIERARQNGTYIKAPNGADTNLTPKQWAQVRTNAFKDWFGDWENSPEKASKVVDENGEPKVVFHGTPLRRDQITPNRGWQKDGITYISQEAPFYTFRGGEYSGMIFTSVDAEKARSIAEKRAMSIPDDMDGTEQWTEEGYVYDLFVDVKNPFVPQRDADIILSSLGDEIPTLSFYGGQGDTVSVETAKEILNSGNSWLVTETPQFVAEIKKLGYDGLIGTDEGVDYIACFNPNQLKDAYDNTGTFSTGSDDIRFRTIVVNPRYGSKIETVRTNHTSVYKAVDKYLRENFDEKDYTTHTAKTGSRYLELNIGNDTLKVRFANHTPRMEASDNMDTIGNGKEIAFFPGGDIGVEIDISLSGDRSKEIIDLIKGMKEYSSSEVKKEVSSLIDGAKTDPFPDVASPQLIEELSHYIGTEMAGTLDTQISEYYKYRVNENVYKQESKSRDSKLKQNKYVLEQYKTIFRDFVQESPKLIKAVGGGYWYNGATGSIRIVPPFPIDYGMLSDKLMSSHFIPIPGINKKEGKRQIVQEYVDEWSRRLTESGIFLSEEYVSEGAKITEAQQEIDNIREQYNFWVKAKLNTGTSADIRYRTAEDMEEVNQRFNEELEQQIEGRLEKGHVYQLGRPSEFLRDAGIPDLPIEMPASQLEYKSTSGKHDYDLSEVMNLPNAIAHPIATFAYGDSVKSQNILTVLEHNGENFLVGMFIRPKIKGNVLEVNSIRNVFPKNGASIVKWINQGKLTNVDKEKLLHFLDQQRTNLADVAFVLPDEQVKQGSAEVSTATNIVENFENPKLTGENSDGTMNTRFRREAPDVSSYIKISMDRKGVVDLSAFPAEQADRIRKLAEIPYGAKISGDIASFPDYQSAEDCLIYIFNNNDIISDDISNAKANNSILSDITGILDRKIKWGGARRVWVDEYQPLKALQNLIEKKTGISINNREDAWDYTGQMEAVSASRLEEYKRNYYIPLLEAYSQAANTDGIGEEILLDYIRIKSGIERNARMRREALERWDKENEGKNMAPNSRENYIAYLSTQDYSGYYEHFKEVYAGKYNAPQDFVDYIESVMGNKKTLDLWQKINNATHRILDISVYSGLLSKESSDKYKSRDKFYVPLRGFEGETMDEAYNSNVRPSSRSVAAKKAEGRTSMADNPIAYIFNIAATEIDRSGKNIMKRKLLELLSRGIVKNHFCDYYWVKYKDGHTEKLFKKPRENKKIEEIIPVKGVYSIRQKYERAKVDENGNLILDREMNPIWEETDEIPTAEELEKGLARISRARKPAKSPIHKTRAQLLESTVDVYVSGERVSIEFTNPIIANSLNGTLNIDGISFEGMARLNRYMSRSVTSWNPGFVLVNNALRDLGTASANTAIEHGIIESARANSRALHSIAALRRVILKREKIGTYTDKEISDFLIRMKSGKKMTKEDYNISAYLFIANGGETGYIGEQNIDEYRKFISDAVKYKNTDSKKQGGIPKKLWKSLAKFVENTGRITEDITRLNQFIMAIREGDSMDKSISRAKNVSTNFNRRGSHEGVQWLFDSVMFLNAALQGIDRQWQIAKKHPWKTLGLAVTFPMVVGFVTAWIASVWGSDDDDRWGDSYHQLSSFKRYNNFVFPKMIKGGFVTIPLPQIFRAFHAWGVMIYDSLFYNPAHPLITEPITALDFALALGQDVVPFTYGSWTNIGFSFTQPAQHAISNESFTGAPLYKETPWNENVPEWRKAYGNTSDVFVNLSKWINEMTGGNYAEKGWLEQIPVLEKLNNPAVAQQLALGYTGGLGSFILKSVMAGEAVYDKLKGNHNDFSISEVPLVGSLVGDPNDRIPKAKLRSKWYEFANKARDSKRADSELLKELFIDEFIENTRDSDKVLNKSVYDGLNVHIRNLMKLEGMAETWEDDLVSGDLPADEAIRTSAEIASLRNTIDNTLYDIINELKIAQ
jgi:hypothetical protein